MSPRLRASKAYGEEEPYGQSIYRTYHHEKDLWYSVGQDNRTQGKLKWNDPPVTERHTQWEMWEWSRN